MLNSHEVVYIHVYIPCPLVFHTLISKPYFLVLMCLNVLKNLKSVDIQ